MNAAKKILLAGTTLATLNLALLAIPLHAEATQASSPASSDADDDKPIGAQSGEKGGIYVVGRAFKTAGSEMGDGFKAAGRGIKKGGQATGRGFKKAGSSIKNFFTGEKN